MNSCLLVLILLLIIESTITIGYLIPNVAVKVLKPPGLQMIMQG